ncbi:hypothetical protein N4G70_36160 [Streptomyces sp. ASQP_92]|uniref:hypothetical protein n=1 Tax=Streptomyces sp. ASQP_92 TaxID=2979116 RepID=UPI0021BF197A|nr:hypothetical protein [Streptomyces sp. ASQP_92]MCT9094237.1 hypothetical protein [Streptomyces sp. ASQP_92]
MTPRTLTLHAVDAVRRGSHVFQIRMSQGRGATFTPTAPAPADPVPGPPAGSVLVGTAQTTDDS